MEGATGDQEGEAKYTLDEALTAIGFGKYQLCLLIYAGVGSFAEAVEMMLLSYIGVAIQPEWGLSSNQVNLVSILTFCGILVGSYLWGTVSDSYGRKKGILGAAISAVVAGFLSTLAPRYTLFLILRCIYGIGLGGGHVFNSWFMEFLVTPNRGIWMVGFSGCATLGTIAEAFFAWWIMPRFGWRWLVGVSSIPHLAALIFYAFIPESPRQLCAQRKLDKVMTVLENAAAMNNTNLPEGRLVIIKENEIAQGGSQTTTSSGDQPLAHETDQTINERTPPPESSPEVNEGTPPPEVNEGTPPPESSPEVNEGTQPLESVEVNERTPDEVNQGTPLSIPQESTLSGPITENQPPITTNIEHGPEAYTILKQASENQQPAATNDTHEFVEINEEDTAEDTSTVHDAPIENVTVPEQESENVSQILQPSSVSEPVTPNIVLMKNQIQVTVDTHVVSVITEVVNVSTAESDPLLASTRNATPDHQRSKLAMLVSPQWITTTVLLWFLFFSNVFSYYGIIPLTKQLKIGPPLLQTKHPNFYHIMLITTAAEIPGVILAAALTWSQVGRKNTMAILFLLGFVLQLPLLAYQNAVLTMFLVFGVRMFMSAGFIVLQIYAEEVYPTIIRATGVGVASAIGGVGGMVWPLVGEWLSSHHHQILVIILFEVKIALSVLFVVLLPFETIVRDLQ